MTLQSRPNTCDVLLVGFGPVGAVAACLLGQAGLSTVVIDRDTTVYDKPRAISLDHEVARVLQNLGLAPALAACAAPFSASAYFGVEGQLIKRLDMLPPPYPQGWTPSMVFHQPALETAIRERAIAYPAVQVMLDYELTAVTQTTDGVVANVQTASGAALSINARYLLGCDGASSTVRRLLNIAVDDLEFDQSWLVVDVHAQSQALQKLPQTSVQYCEPARPSTFVIGTGQHRRWEFMLLPGEDPAAMQKPEQVWRLLSRWIQPTDAALWRAASYRFHALIARQWRVARVLLAGDAAHQQPPFLGQGLCQGIRDAANICWKLARVLKGAAPEALLDTYQQERAPHVRKLIDTIKHIGGLIGERDVSKARLRDARLIAEAGGTIRSQPRQDLMPQLDAGCLGAISGGRGALFPQPWIETASGPARLDDMTGSSVRLMLAPGVSLSPDAMEAVTRCDIAVVAFGEPLNGYTERDGVVAAWFERHNAQAALVRPDHYVFATAETPEAIIRVLHDFDRQLSARAPLA